MFDMREIPQLRREGGRVVRGGTISCNTYRFTAVCATRREGWKWPFTISKYSAWYSVTDRLGCFLGVVDNKTKVAF